MLFPVSDINKFLWMVRIGGSTDRGEHIKETDYFTPQGEFRIDKEGSSTMLNCLMYKMCYYRFGSVYTEQGKVITFIFIQIIECNDIIHNEVGYTSMWAYYKYAAPLGHYFFISWFTDFLAGKTGRSVGEKKKIQNNYIGPIMSSCRKKLHGNRNKHHSCVCYHHTKLLPIYINKQRKYYLEDFSPDFVLSN